MKAGRELDALVAEKVMGWRWCPWDREKHPGQQNEEGDGYWITPKNTTCTTGRTRAEPGCPHYSTDIAAAWEAAERMRAQGFDLILSTRGPLVFVTFRKLSEQVVWDPPPPESFPVGAAQESAPLAICLAALKAAGVDLASAEEPD